MLSPLRLTLTENQQPLVQTAIDEQLRRRLPFMGEVPSVTNDVLVIEPHDFLALVAYMPRSGTDELEAFRIRAAGAAEISSRLGACTRESSRAAYSSLLEHLRATIPVGAGLEAESPS